MLHNSRDYFPRAISQLKQRRKVYKQEEMASHTLKLMRKVHWHFKVSLIRCFFPPRSSPLLFLNPDLEQYTYKYSWQIRVFLFRFLYLTAKPTLAAYVLTAISASSVEPNFDPRVKVSIIIIEIEFHSFGGQTSLKINRGWGQASWPGRGGSYFLSLRFPIYFVPYG